MKLEDILDMWVEDAPIDNSDLGNESLKIPNLHGKYLRILSVERLTLQKLEAEFKQLYKLKHEYYSGSLDIDTIKEKGWQQNQKLIIKTDIGMHIDADEDIQKLTLKIGLQKEKVSAVDHILKTIMNRNYTISNTVNYLKLMNGIS
jgi:hypothetical protein